MKTFRCMYVVAAVAAICLCERAASAQSYYQGAPGNVEFGMGSGVYPAGAMMPTGPAAPTPPALPPMVAAQQAVPGAGPMVPAASQPCGNAETCVSGCCHGGDPAWHVFGDFLYLRPRNETVEYAVPTTTVQNPPLQTGITAVMDPQFSAGIRVGVERALNDCSSVSMAYTYYRDENNDGPVTVPAGSVVQSMVFNPNSPDAGTAWTTAAAHEVTSFQYVDLDFNHNLWGCDCSCVNYFVGMRYAKLEQEFDSTFADTITANMLTHVNFDGLGLRFGVDGERALTGGFYTTAKLAANLIGGEFRADYLQTDNNAAAAPVANTTNWRSASFVTILEAEASVGWQSPNGRFRAALGYLVTDWCNAVKTSDYINSIQTNSYHGGNQMGTSALVFDGLTARAEFTW